MAAQRESPVVSKAAGMKLGAPKAGKSFMDAMAAEDDLKEIPPMSAPVQNAPKPEPVAAVSSDPIGVVVEEKISVVLNREGAVEQLEVKGNLYVSVNDPNSACCRLKLRSTGANGITFQVPKGKHVLWLGSLLRSNASCMCVCGSCRHIQRSTSAFSTKKASLVSR